MTSDVFDRAAPPPLNECVGRFSDDARRAVYDAIALRRDVRHFRVDGEVDEDALLRVLGAAHLAPSVGFSQPWGFVVIRDVDLRSRVRESFLRSRAAESVRFPPSRREKYLSYRLEGILDAPVNVCVAVDLRPRGEAILGTTVQPEAVRASACCAVENLWLAARVEGLGVGWVSIVEPSVLRAALDLPAGVEPIAYLCVGPPVEFRARPLLEETKWLARRPLGELIHRERWVDRNSQTEPSLERVPVNPAQSTPTVNPPRPVIPTRFNDAARLSALQHQDRLTKPHRSLGKLEDIAAWYAGALGRFPCEPPERAAVAVFAADHGVVAEAVSAYSSQLTAATLCNLMAGGAALNVLARRHRVGIVLVDVGVAGDLSAAPLNPEIPLRRLPIRAGTRNLRREWAMTRAEAHDAMRVGVAVGHECADEGVRLVATGEVGIGNTTAAAAIVCVFTGASPVDVVGRGTGIDDETHARKIAVVEDALRLHALDRRDPQSVLAAVGGLELAATVGFILGATERGIPVVLDGFLAGTSALVACALRPEARRFLLASHASAERGAGLVLDALGLEPLLSLGMRLGEGTGAVLGIDLVRSAVALQSEMATFATAGVVRAHRGAGETRVP